MLYLIATPIGNMGDITLRALKTIEACDYLLCEDTRHSKKLLFRYELQKPLKSYHKFNEARREAEIIQDLQSGMTIGLLSDAGTPGIADPGTRLVAKCRELGLEVNAIPGACSPIAALTSSGLCTERFQFVGFLPKTSGRLTRILQEAFDYPGTTICFDTPHRILKTLKLLLEIAPDRKITVARELTKKFEEVVRGTPGELLEKWKKSPPKGEIILLIDH